MIHDNAPTRQEGRSGDVGGGEDMGGGRQLLIDVKNAGDADDFPVRVHVLLIHETAMSVTESGVMVSM